MEAPVSSTPRYSRPPSQIRTQNTRSRAPPERPRQNSAGQVTSNPLFRNLRAILMKRLLFLALPSSPPSCSRLAPCSRWACVCERVVGSDWLGVSPWIRAGVASVLVQVLCCPCLAGGYRLLLIHLGSCLVLFHVLSTCPCRSRCRCPCDSPCQSLCQDPRPSASPTSAACGSTHSRSASSSHRRHR